MSNTKRTLITNREVNKLLSMSNRSNNAIRSSVLTSTIVLLLSIFGIHDAQSQCSLACNNSVQISLDNSCYAIITPDLILEGYDDVLCSSQFNVSVEDRFGNNIGDEVGPDQVGQTLKVSVTEISSDNSCWGTVSFEDKTGPILTCMDVTVLCTESTTPASIGFPVPVDATITGNNPYFVLGLDGCGPSTLVLQESVIKMDCSSPLTEKIIRTWSAEDQFGNKAIPCTDTVLVYRTDLSTIVLPPNYDNFDLPALTCDSVYVSDDEGYPAPSVTGMPTGAFCENIQMTYENIVIPICEKSYKLLRNWTIFDWCTGEVIEHGQVIKVADILAPIIICPADATASTGPNSCTATYTFEPPSLVDNCTTTPTYDVSSLYGVVTKVGNYYTISNLPIGIYEITYTAYDDCGNSDTCTMDLTVQDLIAPIAVCDEHTVVAVGSDGLAKVYATTFDDGSHDNCQLVDMEARRIGDNCGIDKNYNVFKDHVYFCCEDIKYDTDGNRIPVMVEFRVTDASGNSNTCMVEVEVLDDLNPYLIPPADITLECTADYESILITGDLPDENVVDNCEWTKSTKILTENLDKCGRGTVIRQWTAVDASGNSASRNQTITLIDFDPFGIDDIEWPDDVTLTSCGANTDEDITGVPIINDDVCSLVAISKSDDTYTIVQDGCAKILRRWTVIDVCTYDEDWNGFGNNYGYYEHIQVIKIINNVAPEITNTCQDTIVDFYDSCGGQFEYQINATDDCTEDLEYRVSIDYDNDGIFEIFDESRAGGYFGTSFIDEGLHRMRWIVEDKCGNFSECDFLFEMKDAKAPSPYCLSSVTTAVMSTDGTIGIWATDYDIGAQDNCTAHEDLIFSFSENVFQPSYDFDCSDIPDGIAATIPLEVWVRDEAGNQDYCTVYIELQDNNGDRCEATSTVKVEGNLATANNEGIAGAMVRVNSTKSGFPKEQMTDATGLYAFTNMPFGGSYDITVVKNDDIDNGVTTLDLVLIQKHILGLIIFKSPYQIIASDINNSSTITASDLIAMRKVILGISDQFPGGQKSWRFSDRKEQFIDALHPFPFKEMISLDGLDSNSGHEDFMGIKIGDVNHSVSMNENKDAKVRNNSMLVLSVDNINLESKRDYAINITAANYQDIIATQFTMNYDNEFLKIVNIESGEIQISESNYAINEDSGTITFSWDNDVKNQIQSSDVLLTMNVTTNGKGNLADHININSSVTVAEAYNSDYESLDVQLRFNESDLSNEFVLMQNTPNPFTDETNISFMLPDAGNARLSIYDVAGKMIKVINSTYNKGLNTISISRDELNTSGVMYYKLEAANNVATGKMIGLE